MIGAGERRGGPDWEELSALVDGELAPERLAAVAARIADDNEAARAFATLAAVKARTATLRTDRPPRATRRRVRSFAVLMLVAGLGASLALARRETPSSTGSGSAPDAGMRLAAGAANLQIPNLDAANLRLERVNVAPDDRPVRAEAFYRGERGCRVRLTIAEPNASEDAVPATSQVARWTVGAFAYRLTGEQLDAERFAATVTLAEAGSRGSGSTRIADMSDAFMSRPCLG